MWVIDVRWGAGDKLAPRLSMDSRTCCTTPNAGLPPRVVDWLTKTSKDEETHRPFDGVHSRYLERLGVIGRPERNLHPGGSFVLGALRG